MSLHQRRIEHGHSHRSDPDPIEDVEWLMRMIRQAKKRKPGIRYARQIKPNRYL